MLFKIQWSILKFLLCSLKKKKILAAALWKEDAFGVKPGLTLSSSRTDSWWSPYQDTQFLSILYPITDSLSVIGRSSYLTEN